MATTAVSLTPTPAQASGSTCTRAAFGDLCAFYRINYGGSRTGFWECGNADYLNPWVGFQSAGDGQHNAVGNNAGSFRNDDLAGGVRVYEHANWTGRSDHWAPGAGSGNSNFVTRNNNRSHLCD
ncbi:hypothetical protein AB0283_17095 [Micromonospora vinacea]|uniref:hypothetical protein n=1 Tax=Micromonospora vinacea TaxID=709878 RepID=UPI00344DFF72